MESVQPDYEALKFWLYVAQLIATVLIGVYVYITRKSQVNTERINQLEADHKSEMEQTKERVIRLEERPSYGQDIIDIHKRINAVSEGQKSMEGEFKQTSEAVKRMHDFMIRKGNK